MQRNEVSNNVTPTSQANNVPKNAILALLNGGAAADGVTAAETSNISPVPPLQTLQVQTNCRSKQRTRHACIDS